MKALVCQMCKFIALDGVAPDKCPVCGAPKTAFKEVDDGIKTPQDANNLSDLEKKHIPVITVVKKCGLIPEGCQDVHVNMGEIPHPMQAEHYIVHIDFYLDKKFIARVILTPEALNPAAALHVKASSGKLSAISLCNIHGAWIKETDL